MFKCPRLLPLLLLYPILSGAAESHPKIQIKTGNEVNVLIPENKKLLTAEIFPEKTEQGLFQCRIYDFSGNEVLSLTRRLNLLAGNKLSIPLPLSDKQKFAPLSAELFWNGRKTIHRFAYMDPAGPTPEIRKKPFLFGVCSHPERRSWKDQEKEALAAGLCGVKVLRYDYIWPHLNPKEDLWTLDATRHRNEIFRKQGISIIPILGIWANWAKDPTWKPLNPDPRYAVAWRGRPISAKYRKFVRGVLEFSKEFSDYIEICNEPDLAGCFNFSSDGYAEMAKILWEERNEVAPQIKLLTGGFAVFKAEDSKSAEPNMMQNCVKKSLGFYDVYAFHGHGMFEHFRPQVEKHRAFRRSIGEKCPWYANETAISATGNGEWIQCITLFQKLLYSWANDAIGYNWYDLCNDGYDGRNPEHNFGLMTRDFHPKAPYVTYNMLAKTFRDAVYHSTLSDTFSAYLWRFRDSTGCWLIPGWSKEAFTSVYLPLSTEGEWSSIDLFGNHTHLDFPAMILSGSEPFLMKVAKCTAPPDFHRRPLLKVPLDVPFAQNEKISFELCNPLGKPLPISWKVYAEKNQSKSFFSGKTILSAGGTGNITLELNPEFRKWELQLFPDRTRTAIRIPFQLTNLLVAERKERKNPDFLLNRAEQTTSFLISSLENAHLFRTGPEDISVKGYLSRDDRHLRFRIIVRDDIHCPVDSLENLWQGDSIQMDLKFLDGRGMWKIGFARNSKHQPITWTWTAPKAHSSGKNNQFQLKTFRNETERETLYEIALPLDVLGLKAGDTFLFNFLVNDNDGNIRESCMELVTGMAHGAEPKPNTHPLLRIGK